MSTRIAINGVIGDESSATISVLDRGFLYGDSVYEVLRTYDGRLFALDDHMARLCRSAELLEIALPISPSALVDEIAATVDSADLDESYVRVVITRGAGPIGLDPALAENPLRVVIVRQLVPLPPALYREGVKVSVVPSGRAANSALPAGAKSGNYLVNLMALRHARQHDAHEALMLDADGFVAEGSTSNVFAVFGGPSPRIATPRLGTILEGITRRKVMALAKEAGLSIEEAQVLPSELLGADELFLTGTLREILPVTQVDTHRVGSGRPGPVTQRLIAAFRALTRPHSPDVAPSV